MDVKFKSLRVVFPVACDEEGGIADPARYPAACGGEIHSFFQFVFCSHRSSEGAESAGDNPKRIRFRGEENGYPAKSRKMAGSGNLRSKHARAFERP